MSDLATEMRRACCLEECRTLYRRDERNRTNWLLHELDGHPGFRVWRIATDRVAVRSDATYFGNPVAALRRDHEQWLVQLSLRLGSATRPARRPS